MYNWEKTARYMLREVLGYYTKEGPLGKESTSWDYIQENVDPRDWEWLWTEGVRLGLFRYGHLYSGTIQTVRRLAEIGEVVLITHRPKQAVNDTLDWLSFQHLPIAGVHLLTNQEPKSSVKPECDVYLDDKPENVIDLRRGTSARLVCLMRRPWNRDTAFGEKNGSLVSVGTWYEFIEKVRIL